MKTFGRGASGACKGGREALWTTRWKRRTRLSNRMSSPEMG